MNVDDESRVGSKVSAKYPLPNLKRSQVHSIDVTHRELQLRNCTVRVTKEI